MPVSRLPFLSFAPALALLLSGCGNDDARPVEVVAIGDPAGTFAGGPRLPLAAQLLRSATVAGLVGFDEQGRVVPALADRWIVTDDGLSYIFRLRDGAWPDGSAISGESARTALLQAIAAQRAAPLGQDLAVIADVRAMAGRVIEIRVTQQVPDMLQLLAQPELGLAHAGRGSGPMKLKREKDAAVLRPIAPEDRGQVQEEGWDQRARRVRLQALSASAALKLFTAGRADYVLGGGFADFPRIEMAGVARRAIRFDPVAGLFGLQVVRPAGFLAAAENREALAMAIDRDALAAALGLNGWNATTRIVNPGLEGDNGTVTERWPGRSIEERRSQAAARVAKWRGAARAAPTLTLALPSGPGADQLFARLAADFKAIGIDVQRVPQGAAADLRLVDAVARYARPTWFFNQLSCASTGQPCSSQADSLAAQALTEPDPAKRAELYAQAEAQLTVANGYLPLGIPIRWSLSSGPAAAFAPNRFAIHPLMPLAVPLK